MVNQQTKKSPEAPNPNYAVIRIDNDFSVIVDPWSYSWLRQYPWKIYRHQRCYYAKYTFMANGKNRTAYMHRVVACTPSGYTCHHRNRQTLDNRRKNLLNMTKADHRALHQNDGLLIKFHKTAPTPIDLSAFYGV